MATDHPDDDCDSLFVVCTISDPPAADAVAGGAALALLPPATPSPPRRRRGLRCRFSRRRSPALQFAGHGACRPWPTHRGGLDPRAADEQHPFLAFRGWAVLHVTAVWSSPPLVAALGKAARARLYLGDQMSLDLNSFDVRHRQCISSAVCARQKTPRASVGR